MKRLHLWTIGAASAVIIGLALGATAQTPPALLSSLEVQQLVKSNDPNANARLRDHFTALAATYEAEARQHATMAQGFSGNPNHPAPGMAEHCKRLADIATQEAATVKEIAAYHAKLAAGATAAIPTTGTAYEGGKGATVPSEKQLHEMAMDARTSADHHALEEYYMTVATKGDAAAAEHVTMAQMYRASARKGGADPAAHCDRMVTLSRAAAKEARAAAAEHKQLANVG